MIRKIKDIRLPLLCCLLICLLLTAGCSSYASGIIEAAESKPAASFSTIEPSPLPSPSPSPSPSPAPTPGPTPLPTATPTPSPTITPTIVPTKAPTAVPTAIPTKRPSSVKVIDGVTYYNGFADPRTITPEIVEDPTSLTALVNKYWTLKSDYVPQLVNVDGTYRKLHPAANDAWILLRAACKEATGIKLELLCGYRSYATQTYTFADAIKRKGIELTVAYNALEGRSEHQLGLAIDVTDGLSNKYTLSFSNRSAFAWLLDHAHEYGYILRYQTEKEEITGYHSEPWHYRYVGIDAATVCHEQSWTLEEYKSNHG